MHAWFDQIDAEEIAEICDGVPRTSVDNLRRLLEDAERLPTAFLNKSHDTHESILHRAFDALRLGDPGVLARVVIYGDEPLVGSRGFSTVSPTRCRTLAAALMKMDVSAVIRDCDLGDRTPVDAWRSDLGSELQDLVDVYRTASDHGHQVLTGNP